jgi:hypothetical protein
MTGLEKRQKLFHVLAANQNMYAPNSGGLFNCPICFKPFGPESVEGDNPLVNLAHVYPDSCGGNVTTLACAECNTRISKWESHLAIAKKHKDVMDGQGDLKATMRFPQFGNARVRGRLSKDESGGMRFIANPKLTSKTEKERIEEGMKDRDPASVQPHIELKHPDHTKITGTLLHAAYMAMFHRYGYEYIFYSKSQWIRDILLMADPPKDIPMVSLVINQKIDLPENYAIKDIEVKTSIVWNANGTKCLAAIFPAYREGIFALAVFVPGFGDDGEADYAKIMEHADSQLVGSVISTDVVLPDISFLADPKVQFEGMRRWYCMPKPVIEPHESKIVLD